MSKIKNQNGFTIIELLIVLVLVGIIAVASVYAWSKRNTPQTSTHQNTTATTSETPNGTATKNRLKITEWGLSGSEKEGVSLAYTMSTDHKTATINNNSAADSSCSRLGSITQYAATDTVFDETGSSHGSASKAYATDGVNNRKIGSYYYAIKFPQAGCGTPSTESSSSAINAGTTSIQAFLKSAS